MSVELTLRILYQARARYRDVQRRLVARVVRRSRDECWPWIGVTRGRDAKIKHRSRQPYGSIKVDGRFILAHRFALFGVAAFTRKEFALHRCDNTLCCNPAHLFAGTNADNMRDARDKGRLEGRLHTYRVGGRFARKEAA